MARDVVVALDFPDGKSALNFLDNFTQGIYVKIGMELFYREGPEIVREVKKRGHSVFLDLKLHDIPNTVRSATKSLLALDVDMINYHVAGGPKMLREAVDELNNSNKEIISLGVTILTSTDEDTLHNSMKISSEYSLEDIVREYGQVAKKSGLNGVVCSALEVPSIKKYLGDDFITVTPGIRRLEDAKGDQVRIVTPKDARELGSDYIVVGRPITKSENPLRAYREIRDEFLGGSDEGNC